MKDTGQDTPRRRVWADLGPRVISAVILVPIVILALYLGHVWFALLVGGCFAGAYREWEIMTTGQRPGLAGTALIGIVALVALVFPFFGEPGSAALIAAGVVLALAIPSPARVWRAGGVLYCGLVVIALMAMRGVGQDGVVAGALLALSVWLTDSAAFFTGRHIGGAKLSPDISPSKTWSGALGGLVAAVVAGTVFWVAFTPSPWWIGAIMTAVFSLSGQLGDLAESAIKRHFSIKDSGDLIPGHGGLMDRLDSLALASLVLFVIGALHAGPDMVAAGVLIWQ